MLRIEPIPIDQLKRPMKECEMFKMMIVEILDPELAMCLEGAGFPYHYVRKEGDLEIIAFVSTPEFDDAFERLDEDEGGSVHQVYEVDAPTLDALCN